MQAVIPTQPSVLSSPAGRNPGHTDPGRPHITRPKRKIQTHRKSRQGCRNCKLRKVKCDETRPRCDKCDRYGILCNYDLRNDDLQLSKSGASAAIDLTLLDLSPASTSSAEAHHLAIGGDKSDASSQSSKKSKTECYRPTFDDLETLGRFFSRTIHTLGAREFAPLYYDVYTRLTESTPFLFHIVLAVTMVHDSILKQPSSPSDFQAIARHWSLGASLLNRAISQPISQLTSSTRDAMWACAGLLGCLAFSVVDAESVEESWPLKPPDPSDLGWLGFCEGKTVIFKVSDPLREDSLFAPMRGEMAQFMSFETDLSFPELQKALPVQLLDVCDLNRNRDSTSTASSNPCLASASLMARLMPLECTQENYILFLAFFRTMEAGFKQLLVERHPGALVLLLFWYSKVLPFDAWWLRKRARLEFGSICTYLTRVHGDDERVTTLVRQVKEKNRGIEGG
ncbi:hypothetical protein H2204_005413 [Knufia peltigerae]|uniref:Zn(2)-C6 fungal-type domain-containing protein n=1 Tax=Knufia peltigerae TaxID=1002370 RepID=A0AA39CYS1_9EURO|nr:hypothetical protein H2204_005413 [Knufia peltigerae]